MASVNLTRGVQAKAQKVVLYGVEGIGKSTFISNFPKVVYIDTEGSTANMDVLRTPRPTSWAMLLATVRELQVQCIKDGTMQTLAIDTADWAERLCATHVCQKLKVNGIEDMGYGKGYTYLEEEFGKLLDLLQEVVDMGCNVALTAHAQMRKFEQPDEVGSYDRWELKLEKKTAALVKEWADILLFANYETFVVKGNNPMEKNKAQGNRRVMYATHYACWDAKNRHGLGDKLPFDYAEIAHCIPAGVGNAVNAPTMPVESVKETNKEISKESFARARAEEETARTEAQEQKLNELMQWDIVQVEDDKSVFPKALQDLMNMEGVSVQDIQKVVASKGYFPLDTPARNYPQDFVEQVLIGAWAQVLTAIKDNQN